MSHIIEKIKQIKNLYHSIPATDEQISEAEHRLELKFSEEYKEYLKQFGAISFPNSEWTGLNIDDFCRVIETTLEARSLYDNFPSDKFIIEDLHFDDNIIVSDVSGNIYLWHNSTQTLRHETLVDYLEECLER